MIGKKTKKAFTLIELLVGITITIILLLGIFNLDINRLNHKQELEIFTNSIKTDFERIRNNALSGKGIGTNLIIPEKWQINYSKSNSGTITYTSYSGSNILNNETTLFQNNIYISEIKCLNLNGNEEKNLSSTETGSLEIKGENISLTGACLDNTSKILEINIKYGEISKTININSLNGLVEIK